MSRWQYHVVNIGTFHAADNMTAAFGHLGSEEWELVAIYDKASNWLDGFEKGFAVFKREVADGAEPEGPWAGWQHATEVEAASRSTTNDPLGGNPAGVCMEGDHVACKRKWSTCICDAEAPAS